MPPESTVHAASSAAAESVTVSVGWWAWPALFGVLLAMLAVDLVAFRGREASLKAAAAWSAVWLALGLGFTFVVWAWLGGDRAGEYMAGYLIERGLSFDNVFVFALIFSYFAVPAALQYKALLWGVVGALALRAVFIGFGAALLSAFEWMIYVFGAFLVITGIRMATHEPEVHPDRNPVVRLVHRVIPVTSTYQGNRILVRDGGRRLATPMLVVLLAIATTDIVFAIDSIPAIFAITTDVFIVFAANAFAVLGLRALYFLLAGMMARFRYLQAGLAAVLVLVGVKMLASDVYKVPVWTSLGAIAALLTASVVASLIALRREGVPLREALAPGRDKATPAPVPEPTAR